MNNSNKETTSSTDSASEADQPKQDDRDAILKEQTDILELRDESFIPTITKNFKSLNFYSKLIKYKRATKHVDNNKFGEKISICTEGEIGVGKSSTNCHFIHEYCKVRGIDHLDYKFAYSRKVERVTTCVNTQKPGNLILIDTPGTNDVQSELADYTIQKMKHEKLSEFLLNDREGISSIVQCIMINEGGRLTESNIESMAKTFHSLTYSFPEYNALEQGGPRLNVIFTAQSKFSQEDDDIGIPGYESENKYLDMDQFYELVKAFKKQLSQKIYQDLHKTMPLEQIEGKIGYMLKDENFYGFKIFKDKEKLSIETTEIQRALQDAAKHGRYCISNEDQALNTPVPFDTVHARNIINKFKDFNQTVVSNQIQLNQDLFRSQTGSDGDNQKIVEIHQEISKSFEVVQMMIDKCPWVFQRMPAEIENFLEKASKHFPPFMTQVLATEVRDFFIRHSNDVIDQNTQLKDKMAEEKKRHHEEAVSLKFYCKLVKEFRDLGFQKQLRKQERGFDERVSLQERAHHQVCQEFNRKIENEKRKIQNECLKVNNQWWQRYQKTIKDHSIELEKVHLEHETQFSEHAQKNEHEKSEMIKRYDFTLSNLREESNKMIQDNQKCHETKFKKVYEQKCELKKLRNRGLDKIEHEFKLAEKKEKERHQKEYDELEEKSVFKSYQDSQELKKVTQELQNVTLELEKYKENQNLD